MDNSNDNLRNEKYNQYVEEITPKRSCFIRCIRKKASFMVVHYLVDSE